MLLPPGCTRSGTENGAGRGRTAGGRGAAGPGLPAAPRRPNFDQLARGGREPGGRRLSRGPGLCRRRGGPPANPLCRESGNKRTQPRAAEAGLLFPAPRQRRPPSPPAPPAIRPPRPARRPSLGPPRRSTRARQPAAARPGLVPARGPSGGASCGRRAAGHLGTGLARRGGVGGCCPRGRCDSATAAPPGEGPRPAVLPLPPAPHARRPRRSGPSAPWWRRDVPAALVPRPRAGGFCSLRKSTRLLRQGGWLPAEGSAEPLGVPPGAASLSPLSLPGGRAPRGGDRRLSALTGNAGLCAGPAAHLAARARDGVRPAGACGRRLGTSLAGSLLVSRRHTTFKIYLPSSPRAKLKFNPRLSRSRKDQS